jgi:hypothetical protein
MTPLIISVILYLIVMTAILYYKPSFLYDHEKKDYRSFGTGTSQSVFSIGTVSVLLAIVCYLLSDLFLLQLSKIIRPSPQSELPPPQLQAGAIQQQQEVPIFSGGGFSRRMPTLFNRPSTNVNYLESSKIWKNAMK